MHGPFRQYKMENRMQQKSDERRSPGGERRIQGGELMLMPPRSGLLSGRLPDGNPELRMAGLVYASDLSPVLKYPGKIAALRQRDGNSADASIESNSKQARSLKIQGIINLRNLRQYCFNICGCLQTSSIRLSRPIRYPRWKIPAVFFCLPVGFHDY